MNAAIGVPNTKIAYQIKALELIDAGKTLTNSNCHSRAHHFSRAGSRLYNPED